MPNINITLYGDIAGYGGGKHIATLDIEVPEGAVIDMLLKEISLPPEERGYLFINSVLHDVPGLYASQGDQLKDGDHVGIFSIRHMWPYQYRQGIHMSQALEDALAQSGAIKNTYRDI
jgi:hypothetical protein